MPSLRGFIMSAEDKSEIDMFKKIINDTVQGAAIDAMNLLMMKSMEKKEEEPQTDETAIIEEAKEEEPEKVESFPKRRGRPPKRMDTAARR